MISPSQPAPSSFLELVGQRHSCRAYRPDPVPREHIETMLAAARLAPSACNRQPWRFAVVTAEKTRRRLFDEGVLPGLRSGWILEAPVLVALGMHSSVVTHWIAPLVSKVDYPWLDLGIAGEHLVLQATELGLGTCWIGWIQPDGVRKAVGWPRSIRPAALITVGWPRAEEAGERTGRKSLPEIASWLED